MLKHAKNCKIVQLNWKASNNWDKTYNVSKVTDLYTKISQRFNVFKQNTGFYQLIKQAEIDVLGLSIDEKENNGPYYYAVDIAYHENGLNYGSSKPATINTILKKLIRSAFILYYFFNVKNGEIIFASPKINPSIYAKLLGQITQLKIFMTAEGFSYNFKLFANDNFYKDILDPLVLASSAISDTSELFMRSFQLINLRENIDKGQKQKKYILNTNAQYNEFKIGATVKFKLNFLFTHNYLSYEEILNLKDKNCSKKVFNLNFPLLVDKKDEQKRYDCQGYNRYWSEIFNDKYYVCSQWKEDQRSLFEKWYSSIVKES